MNNIVSAILTLSPGEIRFCHTIVTGLHQIDNQAKLDFQPIHLCLIHADMEHGKIENSAVKQAINIQLEYFQHSLVNIRC